MSAGYTYCRCRDCMELVVSNDENDPDFCWDCDEAGCEENKECVSLARHEDYLEDENAQQ